MDTNMEYQKKFLKQNEKIMVLLLVFIALIVVFILSIITDDSDKEKKKDYNLYFENISEKKELGKLKRIEEKDNNIYFKVEYPEIGIKEIDNKVEDIVEKKIDSVNDEFNKDDSNINYYYFIDYEIYIGNGNIVSLVLKENIDDMELNELSNRLDVYYFNLDNSNLYEVSDIFNDKYIMKKQELNINNDCFVFKSNKIVYIRDNLEFNLEDFKDCLKIDLNKGKSYENEIDEKELIVINRRMKLNQDTVIYDNDSLNSNIILTLKKDSILNVHGNLSNGFSMIYYENGIGYIETKYLVDYAEEVYDNVAMLEEVYDTDRKILYVLDDVNVRSKTNAKSSKIGVLTSGTKVIQTGESATWLRIEFKNTIGYVKKGYLSDKEIIKYTVKTDIPAQGDIDPSKPMVALTFDDGPNNTSTVRILDTLEKYNVRATFFDLGSLMEKYPDIVKREAKLGEVGTHTYSHKNLNTLSEEQVIEELRLSKTAYYNVLGKYPRLIRAPYGNANGMVRLNITDMALINWNVDSLDWKYRNKDLTLNEINKYGDLNGKIILLHSIHAATADTIEILVPDLIDRGYQLVTISELAYYRNVTLETGTVYYSFK